MRRLVLLFFLGFAGCKSTDTIQAHFALLNNSCDDISLVVNGEEVGPLVPCNLPAQFPAKVLVPAPKDGYATGPVQSSATIAVRDLTQNRLTQYITCTVGENVITTVSYNFNQANAGPSFTGFVNCTATTYSTRDP